MGGQGRPCRGGLVSLECNLGEFGHSLHTHLWSPKHTEKTGTSSPSKGVGLVPKAGLATKANTREADADVNNVKWLICRWQPSGKMGDSCLKTHLYLSVEAEVFIRRERGTDRLRAGAVKFSTCG